MMKKIIIIFISLFCLNAFAGEMNLWKKNVKLPKDVVQGYKNYWTFGNNFDPKTHLTPDYAFRIVNKSDGHPVRFGNQSIRFELRRGDCGEDPGGYDDCAIHNESTGMTSERHELTQDTGHSSLKGVTWNTYSIFLPDDFPRFDYEHLTLGQFHGHDPAGSQNPSFQWDIHNENGALEVLRRTACHLPENKNISCSTSIVQNYRGDLIPPNDVLGKWHDIVLNVKWTTKQDGYLKQWIDGKLVYHYLGNTSKPGEAKNNFQFGIYRGPTPKTPKVSTQIAYYDEIRFAQKSCEKLKLEDLGYSCADLEKQTFNKLDYIPGKLEGSSTMDGKFQLQWYWVDKKIDGDIVTKDNLIVHDVVTISKGKLSFDKLQNNTIISDKYREKITFMNFGDTFSLKGDLDLDTSDPDLVSIYGSVAPDENGSYIGEGVFSINEKKGKKEFIKIVFNPLTGNETAISSLSKEERYVKTLTDRISKKILSDKSVSQDKEKKVKGWVNKELKKWAKDDDDEINTIEGRKNKIKSLTKKGIKKFK